MEGGYTSMSNTTVDNRVVNMQFNNAQFEAGVKQTIKSLDELKKSLDLNTSATGLSTIQRAFDSFSLKNMEQNIESLAQRFSSLGIVGMTVIQNLTNEVTNFVKNKLSAAYNQILTGGWNRAKTIATSRFTLQGLFANEVDGATKVEEAMTSAMNAVTGTAYTMSSAAAAASQLAASGIDTGTEMENTLKAIAGVASMTGDSFDNIAHIFTTVAGNGRLMGMQLTQLSQHGLNAAATIAKSMGTTEEAVRDAVSKGEISFEEFSKAMQDAFGEQAGKANETFAGTMDNIKAQLSKIGEIFGVGIVENKSVIAFLNQVREALGRLKDAISVLGEPFKNLMTAISELGSNAISFLFQSENVKTFFETIGKGMEKLTGWINTFVALSEKFKESPFVKAVEDVAKGVEKVETVSEKQALIAQKIWNGKNVWGDGEARKKALGIDYEYVQKYLNDYIKAGGDVEKMTIKVAGTTEESAEKSTKAMGEVGESAEVAADAFNPLQIILSSIMTFGEGIHLIFETVKNTVKAVGKSFKKVFSIFDIAENIAFFGETFSKLVSIFAITDERAEKLERAFAGLWAVIDILRRVFQGIVTVLVDTFGPVLSLVFDLILDIAATVGDVLSDFNAWEKETGVLSTIFKILATVLSNVIKFVVEFVKKLADMPIIQKVKDAIGELASMIGDNLGPYLKDALEWVEKFFDGLNNADTSFVDTVVGKINDGLEFMIGLFVIAKEKVEDFFDWIFGNEKAAGGAGGAITEVSNGIDNIKNTAEEVTNKDTFGKFFSKIGAGFDIGWEKVKGFGKKVIEFFKNFDYTKVVAVGLAGAVGALSVSLSKLFWNIGDLAKAFTGIAKSIRGFIGGVKETIKSFGKKAKYNAIAKVLKALALVIAVITASLIALTRVDTEKLKVAGAILAGMVFLITMLTMAVTAMAKKTLAVENANKVVREFALVIIAIAGAVWLLTDAVVKLSKIKWNWNNMIKTVVSLALIIAALGTAAVLISKFAPELSKGGLSILLFSAGVYVLAKALKVIAGIEPDRMADSIWALIGIVGLLSLFTLAASQLKWYSILPILGVIASLYLIEIALWTIAYLGVSWDVVKEHLSNFILVFGIFGALLLAVSEFSRSSAYDPKDLSGAAKAMLSLGISLILVAEAVKIIGKMKPEQAVLGVSVIIVLLLAITFMLLALTQNQFKSDIERVAPILTKLARAIALLAIVVAVIGLLPAEALKKGVAVVAALSACLAGLIYITKYSKKIDYKAILAMVAVIAMMGSMIIILSMFVSKDFKSVLAAAGILGLSLIAFGASLMIASQQAKKIDHKPLLIMVFAIIALTVSMMVLTKLPFDMLITAATVMITLMLTFGFMMQAYMKAFEKSNGGTANATKNRMKFMILMIATVLVIAGALATLVAVTKGQTGVQALAIAALGIVAILLSLTLVMKALASVKSSGSKTNNTTKQLTVIISGLVGVILALAVLVYVGATIDSIITTVASVGLLMLAVVGMVYLLSQIKAKIDISTIIALGVAIAGIVAIAYALKQILTTDTDWSQMLSAAGSLVLVMVAVAAALGILTAISSSGAGALAVLLSAVAIVAVLITLAYSLPKIAKGIIALTKALEAFSKIKLNLGVILKLVAVFVALTVGSVLLSVALAVLGVGLLVVGAALVVVGAGGLLLASAIALGAKAFLSLAKALKILSPQLSKLGKAIKSLVKNMVLAIISVFTLIAENKDQILDGIQAIIEIVAAALLSGVALFVEILGKGIELLMNKIVELLPKIMAFIVTVLDTLAEYAPRIAETLAQIAITVVAAILGSMIDYVDQNAEAIANKLVALVKALMRMIWTVVKGLFGDIIGWMLDKVAIVVSALADLIHHFSDQTEKAKLIEEVERYDMLLTDKGWYDEKGQFVEATEEDIKNWTKLRDEAQKAVDEFQSSGEVIFNEIKSWEEELTTSDAEAVDQFNKDMEEASNIDLSESGTKSAETYVNSLKSKFGSFDISDSLNLSGGEKEAENAADDFTEKWTESVETAGMSQQEMQERLKNGWKKVTIDGTEYMQKEFTRVLDGVEVATSGIIDTKTLYDDLDGVKDELKNKGDLAGKNYLEGVLEGLKDIALNSTIKNKAFLTAKDIDEAFRKGLKEESPSKKGEEAGAFYFEGVDIGLRKMATVPVDTANLVAEGLVKTFGATVNSIYSTIDNIDGIQPTITPVLDTTNLQQANALMGIDNLNTQANIMFQNSPQATLAAQVQALSEQVKKLAETDYSTLLEGVNINVDASTKVDGTPLRQMASTYTIEQIDESQRGLILATGGRV